MADQDLLFSDDKHEAPPPLDLPELDAVPENSDCSPTTSSIPHQPIPPPEAMQGLPSTVSTSDANIPKNSATPTIPTPPPSPQTAMDAPYTHLTTGQSNFLLFFPSIVSSQLD
ncbi:hypothetical protein ACA910_003120 [Epithemia clementina (nom. ined.)]